MLPSQPLDYSISVWLMGYSFGPTDSAQIDIHLGDAYARSPPSVTFEDVQGTGGMSDSPLTDSAHGRVFVVDDDDSTRRALLRLIAASGFSVADYRDAAALLAVLPVGTPGCVVTDLRMPGLSGLELQQAARQSAPDLAFVFISGHGVVSDAVAALRDGALDFLEKPVDPDRLLASIRAGLAQSRAACEHRAQRDSARALLARLTPREQQVCRLVGRGLLNKQVASELGTSEKTVKTQRGRAMRKIGATSTAALVDLLRRAGDAP